MIVFFLCRMIFIYAVCILCYLFGFVLVMILLPFVKNKPWPFFVLSKILAKGFLFSAGVQVQVIGKTRLATLPQKVLFVANHSSYIDIPLLTSVLPMDVRFVARENLFRVPFLGWIMRKTGDISVNQKGDKQTLKNIIHAAKKIEQGVRFVIFSEGARSYDGRLQDFKKGTLVLAKRSHCAIVPVAIKGSHHVLSRGKKWIRPAKVTLSIGEPLHLYDATDNIPIDEVEALGMLKSRLLTLLEQKEI